MRSGTTTIVSKQLGRHYIECELHESYAELMTRECQLKTYTQSVNYGIKYVIIEV